MTEYSPAHENLARDMPDVIEGLARWCAGGMDAARRAGRNDGTNPFPFQRRAR